VYCPRLRHFVRLNQNGSIGKCGHMVKAMGFKTFKDLDESQWLQDIEDTMSKDKWPAECVRCEHTEKVSGESIRTKSIERHKILHPLNGNYLIVGGVLDNVCNSACQTCYSGLSTKIGSLEGKQYKRVNNYETFWQLPQNRILEVDVNGGEPTASKNYKKILANLPPNTKIVRMNTNGSRMIKELETILRNRIMVIVTLSFDGTGDVHDYVRWPIKWKNYVKSVQAYKNLQKQFPLLRLDTWTTVSSLNVANLPNILDFATRHNLDHDWAFLDRPNVLNVKYKNRFTKKAKVILQSSSYPQCRKIADSVAVTDDNDVDIMRYIQHQDNLRKINHTDYML
jgi:sulfatase maturation enzyme AslB (radical SAM superfamily)